MNGKAGPSGEIVKSLIVVDIHEPRAISTATLRLYTGGELELYCADSGYTVMMICGEHVREWRRWTTVAAADVPRLSDDPQRLFDAARAALVVESENPDDIDSGKIGARFCGWLRSLDVPYTNRSEDWEG